MFCIYRILLASLARLEPNRVRRVTVLLKMNERESLIELAVEKPWNCVQFVVWRSDRRSAVQDSLSVVLCCAVTTDATSLKVPPSPTRSPYITSSVASASAWRLTAFTTTSTFNQWYWRVKRIEITQNSYYSQFNCLYFPSQQYDSIALKKYSYRTTIDFDFSLKAFTLGSELNLRKSEDQFCARG